MSTLVYVHGTNGSGKSTLARAIITAAGGVDRYLGTRNPRCGTTHTHAGVALLGKYTTSCGGVDGVAPYVSVHREMILASVYDIGLFAEGLVRPGLATCIKFDTYFDQAVFILLDTPEPVCIQNVLTRRAAKNQTKLFSPRNLRDKFKSARSWATSLEGAGLHVERLQYDQAYTRCLELLGLLSPNEI